jgi:lipopolysaccharide biosynthesis protein
MSSDSFDGEKYFTQYPEAAVLGVSAWEHYHRFGRRLGYEISRSQNEQRNDYVPAAKILTEAEALRFFDQEVYLLLNPDLKAVEGNLREHFICKGFKEGRRFSFKADEYANFHSKEYLDLNPDLAEFEGDLRDDYFTVRKKQGRVCREQDLDLHRFSEKAYFLRHPELSHFAGYGKEHFQAFGRSEGKHFEGSSRINDYINEIHSEMPRDTPVRVVEFYLPQFLRGIETQAAQVDLAKKYGIGGFCFYAYWVAGKPLREQPIRQYLDNPQLNLPFCLCWTNENWTRKWGNLENSVFIQKEQPAQDDIDFIKYWSDYLRDPRYIRIRGKPVLLHDRPSLLPNAKATARRWRKWCRENGIGEIYLVLMHSSDDLAPEEIDFDAAIEFEPNNFGLPKRESSSLKLSQGLNGKLYDPSNLHDRGEAYSKTAYRKFPCVNPTLDNTTPERPYSNSPLNMTPSLFNRWLTNAANFTLDNMNQGDDNLVFVNAWPEWSEGAHLEPDRRFGYSWLEAIRIAQLKANRPLNPANSEITVSNVAVLVHAFFLDVLDEILKYTALLPTEVRLFVTTPPAKARAVREALQNTGRQYELFITTNRGRDVLPFVKIYPQLRAKGIEAVIKVHTKKSEHRIDGDAWLRDILEKILTPSALASAIDTFNQDSRVGIIGPAGHYIPILTYLGSNRKTLSALATRLGLDDETVFSGNFFAGTMFIARLSALDPLLSIAMNDLDFEPEAGQLDGTYAHAIERAFELSVRAAGYKSVESNDTGSDRNPSFANPNDYRFATPS